MHGPCVRFLCKWYRTFPISGNNRWYEPQCRQYPLKEADGMVDGRAMENQVIVNYSSSSGNVREANNSIFENYNRSNARLMEPYLDLGF